MASSATGLDHFGAKLFSAISQKNNGQNVFLSPASISLAVSMCAVGARHETLQQMLRVLEVSSVEELTNIAEQMMQVFPPAEKDEPPIEQSDDPDAPRITVFHQVQYFTPLELKLANRLYAQKDYAIQDKYLNLIQKSFRSDIKLQDFKTEGPKAVQTINTWVEKQTNQQIHDILSSKDITSDTRLVLINCIYFKGQWQEKFKETNTNKNADFHGVNSVTSKIELMFQKEYFSYAENKDLRIQVAHLPYQSSKEGENYVFTVVLPNEGVQLNDVEEKLNSNLKLRQQLLSKQNATSTDLLLYLPKFKLETKYELQDILPQLGMEHAFNDKKADFEGIIGKIDDKNRIRISKVIHKTFLNVNEEGTEAAAAGVVIMERLGCGFGAKPKPTEFKADRPFLFFIREVERDLILFSGKFVSP